MLRYDTRKDTLEGDSQMVEAWSIELLKAIGTFFINPMLYVGLIIIFIVSYLRIKRERTYFCVKIFDIFTEMKKTALFALISGLIVSVIALGAGIVFTYDTLILLNIVVILFLLRGKWTLLSAAYTFGFVYFILYFAPYLIDAVPQVGTYFTPQTNLSGIAVLVGVFLIVESYFIRKVDQGETFPELALGTRGKWIGLHRLSKIGMIPFFVLIPGSLIEPFLSFWPVFTLGGTAYTFMLVPLWIGFDYKVFSTVPMSIKHKLSNQTLLLGFIVTSFAVAGYFLSFLSLIGVALAIIGKEWMNYRHRALERSHNPYFTPSQEGLKVLAVLPNSPAERLGVQVGETITRVNGIRIHIEDELYQALQFNGSFCKLEVMDHIRERRILQSALYEGDHHRIGIITIQEPYRLPKKEQRKLDKETSAENSE